MRTKKRIAPIHLISIEAEGFSYFPRQEVIFHEGMTAGIGENGSGKTTFNNMLRLLFGATKFDNGHSLRTFFEREDIFEIYVVGKFNNRFQTEFNMKPFDPIGKREDIISVVCRLVLGESDVKRNYLIYDGVFDLETDLKKNLRWLEVEQFHKQFHEVGISKALIRSFSLSQGNTEEVLKKDEEGLANYLLEICGEQERIDGFHKIKQQINKQKLQFQALSEHKQLEEARVSRLQERIERCKQINIANKEKDQFIFNKPISEYKEYLNILQEHKVKLSYLEDMYHHLQVEIKDLIEKKNRHQELLPLEKSEHEELKNKIKELWGKKMPFELELANLQSEIDEIGSFLVRYQNIELITEELVQQQIDSDEILYQNAIGSFKYIQNKKNKLEQSIRYLEEQGAVEFPGKVKQMVDTLKEKGIDHLLVADYIEIIDESWREAIEALIGMERFTITVSEESMVEVMKIAQQYKYPYWVSPYQESTETLHKNSVLQKVNILDNRISGYLEKFKNYMVCESMEESYAWVSKGKQAILNRPSTFMVVARGGRSIQSNGKYCGKEAFRAQLKEKKEELSNVIPIYRQYQNQMEVTKFQLEQSLKMEEEQRNVRLIPEKQEKVQVLKEKSGNTQNEFSELINLISVKEQEEKLLSSRIENIVSEMNKSLGMLDEKGKVEHELSAQLRSAKSDIDRSQSSLTNVQLELNVEQLAFANDADYIKSIDKVDFYLQGIKELDKRINMLRNISSTDIILLGEEKKMIQLEQKYKQHQKALQDHQEEILKVQTDLEELGCKHKVAEQEYHIMVDEVFSTVRKSLAELCKGSSIQADLRAFHIGEERWKVDYRIAFHGKEMKSYRIKTGLSGGQKVIASLLLTFAAIRSDGSLSFMILDEPFAHLDQERINVAGDFLRQTGVQFFVAMPYSENVKLFMPWVDMQINFRPKSVNHEVAPPITYGVVNDEYLKQRKVI